MSGRVAPTRVRLQGAFGGALVGLSAAVGVLVGARAVVAVSMSGLHGVVRLAPFPPAAYGVSWSSLAVGPTRIQADGLQRLAGGLLALALAAASIAVLNAVVLLIDAGASRRREIAVRAALGEGPVRLTVRLLADLRVLLLGGCSLGIVLGLVAGGALRAAWPGGLDPVGALQGAGPLTLALFGVLGLATVGYVLTGVRVARGRSLAPELAAGGRVTDPARAVVSRRALMALQMAVAGSVLCAALVLGAEGVRDGQGGISAPADASVVPVTEPGPRDGAAWAKVLAQLAAVPGLQAESLATPGALVGLGERDQVRAQCGRCIIGLMYVPMLSTLAVHHAVGPGFFAATGRTLLHGREFTPADRAGARPVAIVNRTFADAEFRQGPLIGHRIQVGADLMRWYTVVGIVQDAPAAAVGGNDRPRPAVYLSALQEPPAHANVILRGGTRAVHVGVERLRAAGWSPGRTDTLAAWHARAAAPLRWMGGVSYALSLLALLLAVQGAHVVSRQITLRRARELAIRRVVGATDARIVRHVLLGSLRGALWGAFGSMLGGAFLVGLLRKASSGVPAPPAAVYAGVSCVLVLSVLAASWSAAREALRVEPATILE